MVYVVCISEPAKSKILSSRHYKKVIKLLLSTIKFRGIDNQIFVLLSAFEFWCYFGTIKSVVIAEKNKVNA
jgi:hypothetical protein